MQRITDHPDGQPPSADVREVHEPPSSAFLNLQEAVKDLLQAKQYVDAMLRQGYPVGTGIVFSRAGKRLHGRVLDHGHDGTLSAEVFIDGARKVKRVAAQDIRS